MTPSTLKLQTNKLSKQVSEQSFDETFEYKIQSRFKNYDLLMLNQAK